MKKAILLSVTFFLFLCCKSQTGSKEIGLIWGINWGTLFDGGTDYDRINRHKKIYLSGVVGLQFRYILICFNNSDLLSLSNQKYFYGLLNRFNSKGNC